MPTDISIKKRLLEKSIEIKEESKAHSLSAMADAQKAANEYGPARDRYDSFRTQVMRKRDMLAQQLAVVEEELRFLHQINLDKPSTKIESGAMVVLDKQTIFILLGIGKIEMDGNDYYVISPVVPLATAMKELKAGDSFKFRGKSMKILEVF